MTVDNGERRSLILVPAWPGQPSSEELMRSALAGERPRTDYVELAQAINGDVMDMAYLNDRATWIARAITARGRTVPAQVTEAFLRRRQYQNIVARADRLGLPLAGMFKAARSRRDLVLISVWLSPRKKAAFLQPLRVDSHLKAIVAYSSVQMEYAAEHLGVPRAKLHHVRMQADERFWRHDGRPSENLICAVGAEARDYATLLEAVRGLDVQVEIAVGSSVLRSGNAALDLGPTVRPILASDLPPNVRLRQQLDHRELRELYARARLVVVPLRDVDFDAGGTVISEAMMMGKPVVLTQIRGQADFIRDGETGLYVPPADPGALRVALERLLTNPEEAERMGGAAKRFAETHLTLDGWVAAVAEVIRAPADSA
ncbi:glycosyltransferase family 4 protein [Blastococcus mobilis]|uniref:Glycosyl transferases group 1 n=1 Tax=Blastococcus mobilis TaxID=1938746 RepID=A0A238Z3R1_9ACTN|nr:glycosyltransferase family 4 protein [Blastococcus mobilis]SNR77513.1 Glycosyl transferases group 1 [Blastococcus mobilis]